MSLMSDAQTMMVPATPVDFSWMLTADNGGVRASLCIDGDVLFEGPPYDNPADAHRAALSIFVQALHNVVAQVPVEILDEGDDDEEDDDGYIWMPNWSRNLSEEDIFRVADGGGGYITGRILDLSKREVDDASSMHPAVWMAQQGDSPLYIIYECLDDSQCEGHHLVLANYIPVWVGHLTEMDDIQTTNQET